VECSFRYPSTAGNHIQATPITPTCMNKNRHSCPDRSSYRGTGLQIEQTLAATLPRLRSELEEPPWRKGMLFPRRGIEQRRGTRSTTRSTTRSMWNHEHDDAGAALAEMRELTSGFTPPRGACSTYRAMLDALTRLNGHAPACSLREQYPLPESSSAGSGTEGRGLAYADGTALIGWAGVLCSMGNGRRLAGWQGSSQQGGNRRIADNECSTGRWRRPEVADAADRRLRPCASGGRRAGRDSFDGIKPPGRPRGLVSSSGGQSAERNPMLPALHGSE